MLTGLRRKGVLLLCLLAVHEVQLVQSQITKFHHLQTFAFIISFWHASSNRPGAPSMRDDEELVMPAPTRRQQRTLFYAEGTDVLAQNETGDSRIGGEEERADLVTLQVSRGAAFQTFRQSPQRKPGIERHLAPADVEVDPRPSDLEPPRARRKAFGPFLGSSLIGFSLLQDSGRRFNASSSEWLDKREARRQEIKAWLKRIYTEEVLFSPDRHYCSNDFKNEAQEVGLIAGHVEKLGRLVEKGKEALSQQPGAVEHNDEVELARNIEAEARLLAPCQEAMKAGYILIGSTEQHVSKKFTDFLKTGQFGVTNVSCPAVDKMENMCIDQVMADALQTANPLLIRADEHMKAYHEESKCSLGRKEMPLHESFLQDPACKYSACHEKLKEESLRKDKKWDNRVECKGGGRLAFGSWDWTTTCYLGSWWGYAETCQLFGNYSVCCCVDGYAFDPGQGNCYSKCDLTDEAGRDTAKTAALAQYRIDLLMDEYFGPDCDYSVKYNGVSSLAAKQRARLELQYIRLHAYPNDRGIAEAASEKEELMAEREGPKEGIFSMLHLRTSHEEREHREINETVEALANSLIEREELQGVTLDFGEVVRGFWAFLLLVFCLWLTYILVAAACAPPHGWATCYFAIALAVKLWIVDNR